MRKQEALDLLVRRLRRLGLSPATERGYVWDAGRFLRWLGHTRVGSVEREDVRRYLAVRAETAKGRALRNALHALRHLFLALGFEEPLPTDGFETDVSRTKPLVLLSKEGVRGLLAGAASRPVARTWKRLQAAFVLRDRACLELLYGLGLRAAEVRAARVSDLDVGVGTLAVRPAKRGPARVLPLPKAAIPHLERYVCEARPLLARRAEDDRGFLLLNRYGEPLGTTGVATIVARVAKRAGVRAHPHAFRRGVATHLVREGASLPAVRDLLGHRNLTATQVYVEIDLEDLRKAVAPLEAGGALRAARPSCSLPEGASACGEEVRSNGA